MNDAGLDAVHFEGEGTDLTIGLLPTSIWRMARWSTVDGIRHLPNVPTRGGVHVARPGAGRRPRALDEAARAHRRHARARASRCASRAAGRSRSRPTEGGEVLRGRTRDRRGCVAARRGRARRPREPDRPARDRLLRDAARRERGQPHRARLGLHVGRRDRRGPRPRQPERRPHRLHDRQPTTSTSPA